MIIPLLSAHLPSNNPIFISIFYKFLSFSLKYNWLVLASGVQHSDSIFLHITKWSPLEFLKIIFRMNESKRPNDLQSEGIVSLMVGCSGVHGRGPGPQGCHSQRSEAQGGPHSLEKSANITTKGARGALRRKVYEGSTAGRVWWADFQGC